MNCPRQYSTELLNAIANNNLAKIIALIQHFACVDQVDMAQDALTPLMLAIDRNYQDIVKFLIDAGAGLYLSTYVEDSPLGLAVTKGNLEIVLLLLQAGANADVGGLCNPIVYAVQQERIDLIKILIEYGANVDGCSASGVTALMVAAITGNIKIVEMLLEEGANPDVLDEYGEIALDKAAYYGNEEIFNYLILLTSASILQEREYLHQKLAKGMLRKQRLKAKSKRDCQKDTC